ncbi:MAG: hypothetical protein PVI44_08305 [Balneolaceae bacterium]|jgi:hypothetical protein
MKILNVAILGAVILIASCGSGLHPQTYSGHVVQISYSSTDTLKNGEWIQIDRWKFPHIGNRLEARNVNFSLPTTSVIFDTLDNRRKVKTKVSPYAMGLHIARYLDIINRDSLRGRPLYLIPDIASLSVRGTFRLLKSDSSMITVKTSPHYPAQISVIQ